MKRATVNIPGKQQNAGQNRIRSRAGNAVSASVYGQGNCHANIRKALDQHQTGHFYIENLKISMLAGSLTRRIQSDPRHTPGGEGRNKPSLEKTARYAPDRTSS